MKRRFYSQVIEYRNKRQLHELLTVTQMANSALSVVGSKSEWNASIYVIRVERQQPLLFFVQVEGDATDMYDLEAVTDYVRRDLFQRDFGRPADEADVRVLKMYDVSFQNLREAD
jgi:hypothetical protein